MHRQLGPLDPGGSDPQSRACGPIYGLFGRQPSARYPQSLAIACLSQRGFPVDGLRSKSWDVFAGPDAPKMDIVITVCDAAAGESCPLWPGAPVKAHWGIPDPAGVPGGTGAERAAFAQAHDRLLARMQALVALPVETLTADDLRSRMQEIAQMEGATHLAQQGGG